MYVVVKGVTNMTTNKEKETIFSLREQGYMLKEIAEMTGKSLSLVKKYVAENNKLTSVCINCGKRMEPGHFKPKKFCCDKCKREYYKKHSECVQRKSSKSTFAHAAVNSSLATENHTGNFAQEVVLREADS